MKLLAVGNQIYYFHSEGSGPTLVVLKTTQNWMQKSWHKVIWWLFSIAVTTWKSQEEEVHLDP